MFTSFAEAFGQPEVHGTGLAWVTPRLERVAGYPQFAAGYAGSTFLGGMYRVHDNSTGSQATRLVEEAFPEISGRADVFGYDWLGRQFAIDFRRVVGGEPQVLMVEPGTGERLEIPTSFADFHNDELVHYADAALASESYFEWRSHSGATDVLAPSSCVGYRVPLFLGGVDTVNNLEVVDLEVYWSLCGQLRRGVTNAQVGTSVSSVTQRSD